VLVHSIKGASLLVGGPGTAKTTVINQFMGKFNSEVRDCRHCQWRCGTYKQHFLPATVLLYH
jgi:Cdc6-like AAA superfamily ATPase